MYGATPLLAASPDEVRSRWHRGYERVKLNVPTAEPLTRYSPVQALPFNVPSSTPVPDANEQERLPAVPLGSCVQLPVYEKPEPEIVKSQLFVADVAVIEVVIAIDDPPALIVPA